jgi:hypothetical protein
MPEAAKTVGSISNTTLYGYGIMTITRRRPEMQQLLPCVILIILITLLPCELDLEIIVTSRASTDQSEWMHSDRLQHLSKVVELLKHVPMIIPISASLVRHGHDLP